MPSLVEIWNLALSHVGSDRVTDPEEPGETAGSLRAVWPIVRDSVLVAHPWNAAMRRAILGVVAEPPAWGYARQFTLPTNPYCLRVWRLERSDEAWTVEGRKLLTDAAAPLRIRYIARIEDPQEYGAGLVYALAARLAHAVAYRRTRSRQKESDMWELWKSIMSNSKSIDGQEGSPPPIEADELLAARI